MKNNSKYNKKKDKWLNIYKLCISKLYQYQTKIISIIKNKNSFFSYQTFSSHVKDIDFVGFKDYFKLTILDAYILKNFLLAFFSVLIVLTLVIIGRLFVKLLEYVVEGRFEIEMISSLLFLSTSKSIILFLPFVIMIGLIICLSRLYRDSEIYALKSSGTFKKMSKFLNLKKSFFTKLEDGIQKTIDY